MPRWNVLLLLPSKYTYEGILPRLALPEGANAHRAVWFFRDHTQEKGTRAKHGGHMVGSYDPFADVVVISYRPKGANLANNFVCVNGIYKNRTCFVEPECTWAAPTCDPLARLPKLIFQILESYLPKNWALVVQGLSAIVPELQVEGPTENCGIGGRPRSRIIRKAMGQWRGGVHKRSTPKASHPR